MGRGPKIKVVAVPWFVCTADGLRGRKVHAPTAIMAARRFAWDTGLGSRRRPVRETVAGFVVSKSPPGGGCDVETVLQVTLWEELASMEGEEMMPLEDEE